MKRKKNQLDTLAEKPTFVLSYDKKGNETWSTKPQRYYTTEKANDRLVWQNVQGELSSDDLILQILKMNPGTELQLVDSQHFPQFVLYLNGQHILKLKRPEGVRCYTSELWTTWTQNHVGFCLILIEP